MGVVLAAAAAAAILAWISQSTLSLATPDGPRIALLPAGVGHLALATTAGVAVAAAVRAGAPPAPLWLLSLILLPFLPVRVPEVFLMWAGRLRLLVWLTVAVLLVRGMLRGRSADWIASGRSARLVGGKPRLAAGLLSLALFASAAIVAAPAVPGGDEPHYLIITQSLLLDGDLRIANNHARGDYQAYLPGTLLPHYIQRGRNGEIYSIHAPGISALVLPAFAIAGYTGVVLFLVAASALGGALVWHVAWLSTRHTAAAWFGWASVSLSSTTIFHTFTIYPDGIGGLLALTGVWALLRAGEERRSGAAAATPWLLHGAALACLPWLHTRFALLAGSLGALLLWRISTTRNPAAKAVAFLSVPAVSALCWVGYFIALYGTPDPSAPYGSTREFSSAFVAGGLAGLLFDQRFGLLANSPVLLCAAAGWIAMLRRTVKTGDGADAPESRRLALELSFVVMPYLLTATYYAMWWGGWSAPARFAAVVVPPLGVLCAAAWAAYRSPGFRFVAGAALAATAFITAVLVIPQRGRLAFNTREGYALWLDWASPLADLGRGLPVWFRDREPMFFVQIAVWAAVAAVGALAAAAILGRRRTDAGATLALAVLAVAAMAGVQATWRLDGVNGLAPAPSQLDLLRQISTGDRALAFSVAPPRWISPAGIPALMRIEPGARYLSVGAGGRRDRPLLTLPAVPAGRYRITPAVRAAGGWLMVGIAHDQFALLTEALRDPPQQFEIDFPVDVRALVVGGDEDARRLVTYLTVEPLAVRPATARLSDDVARRAVRYGSTVVYFMDDESFPEPDAFWIRGGRRGSVVLDPEDDAPVRLELRNAPVPNRVRLAAGEWRLDLELAPVEERSVDVPLDRRAGAALLEIGSSAGFRPSEVEPGSRDQRFLGVWVQVAER